MLGGLPELLVVWGVMREIVRHVAPLSSDRAMSMKYSFPDARRMADSNVFFDTRKDDDMIENPPASGTETQPTCLQVTPPSVVRRHNTRPSRPVSSAAVTNIVISRGPSTM